MSADGQKTIMISALPLLSALMLTLPVCETHFPVQNKIEIDGYTWYGHNRTEIHKNAPKASGGVGILVKESVTKLFDTEIVDKPCDGVLVVKFTRKHSDYNFIVFSCYLPPERSNWGRDAQGFFAHILAKTYHFSDSDAIFVSGDLNARIGSLSDTSGDFDQTEWV